MSYELVALFEDELLLAVHKPEGVCFHNESAGELITQGIVERVRQTYSNDELFPVHRLDKITSGILLFAKNKKVAALLGSKLENREIEKYYLAISTKKPNKKQGSVIGDMEKGRNGSYLLKKTTRKPAVSRFKSFSLMVEKAATGSENNAKWLHLFKIETGKTHQIRVALKSLSSPILGDVRYSGIASDRAYLHAYRLRFFLDGKLYEISDNDFRGSEFNLADLEGKLHSKEKCSSQTNIDYSVLKWPEKNKWPKGSNFI